MKRVVVHVDRLVLRGYQHDERHAVAAGLQAELGRLLAETGAAGRLAQLGHVPRLRLGRMPITPNASAPAVGEAAARVIGRAVQP